MLLFACTASLLMACESAAMSSERDASVVVPDAVVVEPIDARLFRHLSGSFSSNEQSRRDMQYLDVRLATCRVDAPELGAQVMYVEQAVATALARPYRQRIYVVEAGETPSTASSRVLELTTPRDFIGACDEDAMRTVTLSETVDRPGCVVELTWDGTRFSGGTVGMACLTDFNGATYATSEVTIDSEGLTSWDRGYDAADVQVWGAVVGPYEFTRVTLIPPRL